MSGLWSLPLRAIAFALWFSWQVVVTSVRVSALIMTPGRQPRPGIVREVTAVLAGLGVNIEELDTGIENGAWSGERLFRASALVTLPAGMEATAVSDALEAISGEVMVDFTFAASLSIARKT